MHIIENVTIYKCEYCRKESKNKGAMTRHENKCKNNPKNHKACIGGCSYLKYKEVEVCFEERGLNVANKYVKINIPYCTKLDKLMFPYSIERKNLHKKYSTFDGQEPMPHKCDHFNQNY